MTRKALIGATIFSAFAILAGVQTGNAGTVTVSSYSDFVAATTNQVTTDFTGVTAPTLGISCPPSCFDNYNPLIVNNITFSVTFGNFVNLNSPFFYNGTDFPVQYITNAFNASTPVALTITLPSAVTAFGLDFGSYNATPLTFDLSNGFSTAVGTLGFEQSQFLGFLSTLPFSTITLTPGVNADFLPADGWTVLDVTTAETPLPAALPLFATGLGALGLLGWRRKRKAAATLAA